MLKVSYCRILCWIRGERFLSGVQSFRQWVQEGFFCSVALLAKCLALGLARDHRSWPNFHSDNNSHDQDVTFIMAWDFEILWVCRDPSTKARCLLTKITLPSIRSIHFRIFVSYRVTWRSMRNYERYLWLWYIQGIFNTFYRETLDISRLVTIWSPHIIRELNIEYWCLMWWAYDMWGNTQTPRSKLFPSITDDYRGTVCHVNLYLTHQEPRSYTAMIHLQWCPVLHFQRLLQRRV